MTWTAHPVGVPASPAIHPVPDREPVREFLGDLLGVGITVDAVRRLALGPTDVGVLAWYVGDDDALGAAVLADAGFACRAGGALSLVPTVVVDGHLDEAELPATLLENVTEVLNVFARLLNSERTPHLRLASVAALPSVVPRDVQRLLAQPRRRRDYVVTLDGYGDGRLAVAVR